MKKFIAGLIAGLIIQEVFDYVQENGGLKNSVRKGIKIYNHCKICALENYERMKNGK